MKLLSRIRLNIVARRMRRFNKRSIKIFFKLLGTKGSAKDFEDLRIKIKDIINEKPSLPEELQTVTRW